MGRIVWSLGSLGIFSAANICSHDPHVPVASILQIHAIPVQTLYDDVVAGVHITSRRFL